MRSRLLLSVYWFFLLGGLGGFMPFYSLYLSENLGLRGGQVGMVLAVLPLCGLVAQPVWGYVADRTGLRGAVLAVLSLGAAVGYAGLYFATGFGSALLGTALLAMFSVAAIPMCVSVSLALLSRSGPHAFGLVRVWGTVGFMVTVVGVPSLLDLLRATVASPTAGVAAPSEPALGLILPVASVLCLAAALVGSALPRTGAIATRAGRNEWKLLFRHGPYVRILLFMLAAYLCLHGPMILFPVYVRSLGGTVETVSRMWILMLVLEIPLVALTGAGLERLGGRGLLALGVVSGGVRWLACGLTGELWIVYAVQVLHGVTVMGLIIGAPLYVEAVVPEQLRSTGQAILSMVGVSLGGMSSDLASGLLLEHVGPAAPALVGGIGALLLATSLRWLVPPARRAVPATPPVATDPFSP